MHIVHNGTQRGSRLSMDIPQPIMRDAEVVLLMRLYSEMTKPIAPGGRNNLINWKVLLQQYNSEVRRLWSEGGENKKIYTLKKEQLLISGTPNWLQNPCTRHR